MLGCSRTSCDQFVHHARVAGRPDQALVQSLVGITAAVAKDAAFEVFNTIKGKPSGERGAIAPELLTLGASKAVQKPTPRAALGSALQTFRDRVKPERPAGKATLAVQAKTELIDIFAPVEDLVRQGETAGKQGKLKLKPEQDPFVGARLHAGHFGKVTNRLNELKRIIKPARTERAALTELGLLERLEEIGERKAITDLVGDTTLEQVKTSKAELRKALKAEGRLGVIDRVLDGVRKFNDRLLEAAQRAGILSAGQLKAIRAANQRYLPLQRLGFDADNFAAAPRGHRSFSVTNQDLVKSIKGSKREIKDPFESMVRNVQKTVELIERNKVARQLWDLADREGFEDLVVRLDKKVLRKITDKEGNISERLVDRPPPNGFESVGVFIDSQKQTFAVPASVAESIKGLNVRQVDLITKIARLSASALRAGAVTLNIGFIPANAIRDFQSATLKSEVGFTPLDWLKGFSEAIREGNGFSSYLESGASMSGFIERTKPTRVKAKQLFRSRGGDVARTILNPVALLRAIGETVEQAPRRGVFNRAIRKGKTETEAAFFARNATVDFARSGSFLRYVNMWTPFLTACVGGNVNIATALQQRPMRSAAIMPSSCSAPGAAMLPEPSSTRSPCCAPSARQSSKRPAAASSTAPSAKGRPRPRPPSSPATPPWTSPAAAASCVTSTCGRPFLPPAWEATSTSLPRSNNARCVPPRSCQAVVPLQGRRCCPNHPQPGRPAARHRRDSRASAPPRRLQPRHPQREDRDRGRLLRPQRHRGLRPQRQLPALRQHVDALSYRPRGRQRQHRYRAPTTPDAFRRDHGRDDRPAHRRHLPPHKITDKEGNISERLVDRPPPNGFESVGVFIDGQKQTFAVPASVAESIKGLNVRQVDLITKIARLSASALRAGAVTLNIGFIPANAIRDFQSATLKSEVGFTPLDWLKGFSEAIREGNGFSSYLESGASMSGFIERTKPTRVKAKQLFRSRGGDVARTILNPVALLRAIGETVEQAPRRGVFNRAIRKGKTETEAAFFARNATVDFARSGSFLRYVNMWTPFLTARVGGNVNIATALQQRPMRSAAIMGAMIGLPTVATYLHNTRVFPEVYEDIPDFEKQNNYMLIMGDAKDARGRFTQLYKIPKGDVGRFFGNPIENYLAFLDGFNAQAVDDLAVDLLNSSPSTS